MAKSSYDSDCPECADIFKTMKLEEKHEKINARRISELLQLQKTRKFKLNTL
jgi:hypothetical protein